MKRHAQTGGADVNRVAQWRYDPFNQSTNLDIPTDYAKRNAYKRYFFKTNPIVGSAIELHSEFPLSDFHLEHEDEAIEEFLNDMLFESNFMEYLLMASVEYWLIGEFNLFSFYDDAENPSSYTGFSLLDPSKLSIVSNPLIQGVQKEVAHLQLDPVIDKIVEQGPNHPVTGVLYRNLPSDIIYYSKAKQPMPLSPLQVCRMKRGQALQVRGESALERIFPLLMYKDKLRAAQSSIADRHITPIELWKIGETNDPADNEELENFRDVLNNTYYDINKCFHPSHECLTRSGWKSYAAAKEAKDEVYTFNCETGKLEFQAVQEWHEYDFNGELLNVISVGTDDLVTPNHRMILSSPDGISEELALDLKVGDPRKIMGIAENTLHRYYTGGIDALELDCNTTTRHSIQSIAPTPYEGKVWCVTVPNGTVVTRRNGRISISGNSIIFHHAIAYEAVGTQGKMMPLWTEFDNVDNEICAGLLINKGLIMGDSSTFASDVIRYDILINRYLTYRTRLEHLIKNQILGPILKIHEIYVPESRVKSMRYREMCGKGRPLSFPTIRWERQSLRDEAAKLQLMTQMVEKGFVPEATLVRMLNIDPRTAAAQVDKEREDRVNRHLAMMKRFKDKDIAITPEIANILGIEPPEDGGGPSEPGELPLSLSSGGGSGSPSSSLEQPPMDLPNVVPGAEMGGDGATGGIEMGGDIQGAPSESHLPVGMPTG
jgi:hypothetical protein